jgi:hypothetical protein
LRFQSGLRLNRRVAHGLWPFPLFWWFKFPRSQPRCVDFHATFPSLIFDVAPKRFPRDQMNGPSGVTRDVLQRCSVPMYPGFQVGDIVEKVRVTRIARIWRKLLGKSQPS